MISDILDLDKYLEFLFANKDLILKYTSHKDYEKEGIDIDILSINPKVTIQGLIAISSKYLENGLVCAVTYGSPRSYIHVDILSEEKLIVRFDLLMGYSNYQNISISDQVLSDCLKKTPQKTKYKNYICIYQPDKRFDALLRLIDYKEHSEVKSKIKHLHFIKNNYSRSEQKVIFELYEKYLK